MSHAISRATASLSTHVAAETLNRRGIPTATGKSWHAYQCFARGRLQFVIGRGA
jgi:hypothetical protein